jgi:hypothetical protein
MLLRVLAAVVALAAWLLVPSGAEARTPVDLELVLAVDVSYSMDLEEQRLQREGYVAAFRDPDVLKAIRSGATGRIAVVYIEWAGPGNHRVVLPWTLVDGQASAAAFADRLAAEPVSRMRMTSIAAALTFSAKSFADNPYEGTRRVIDISGDGPNNSGPPVTRVRDQLIEDGIVINGLPIMLRPSMSSTYFDLDRLDEYYSDCVIGGVGSFAIAIRKLEDFLPAIRQKLLLEISGLTPEPRFTRAQLAPSLPADRPQRSDCMIGERMWQRYYGDGPFRNP